MRKAKKESELICRERRAGWLFCAPLLFFLLIFSIIPFVYGFVLSFFEVSSSTTSWKFVGLNNFVELFSDKIFLDSWKTMFILLVPKLIINVFVPFVFAELIFALKNKKAQSVYRILILIPIVAPGVVGMLIWKNIYASDGLINSFIKLFDSAFESIDFLNSFEAPYKTILALIFLGFPWIGGTSVLIYLSGLMNINNSIIEASVTDGCSPLRRIFTIDIPLCMGQFRYFIIFGIINGIQDYGIQLVLYKTVPEFLYVPGFYLYEQAYTYDRSGYASAIGVCLFIVVAFFTTLANYLTKKDKTL